MITSLGGEDITPAESTRRRWDEEDSRLAREYDITIRKLELQVIKEQQKLDSWFKIPITIIKLPMYIVLGVGFIAAMIRKHDPGAEFWNLLK